MPKGKGRYEALPAHDEQDEEEVEERARGETGAESGDDPMVTSQHDFLNSQSLPTLNGGGGGGVGGSIETAASPSARPAGQQQRRPRHVHRRTKSSTVISSALHIDVEALDAKLQQWGHALSKKFGKNKAKSLRDPSKPYEILASAFAPVEPPVPVPPHLPLKTLDHKAPLTEAELDVVVESIKQAIRQGVHPRLNKAGSSGSYFAKNPEGKTRGIFKPKSEEPYGSLNPKWSKWFHRNLLAPFFGFGRACLLPNFSYLSEAGASMLDTRLNLYIVPPTTLATLSSPAFFYDWIDRRAYKQKKKPLPGKIGSLQLFLDGYKDASEFLKMHPWPGRAARDTLGLDGRPSNKGRRRKRGSWTRKCRLLCGTAGIDDDESDGEDSQYAEDDSEMMENGRAGREFVWTRELMEDFRLELEKLVILDVLMRNTDRGLDNFMVKVCDGDCKTTPTDKQKEGNSKPPVHRMQPQAIQALSLEAQSNTSKLPYTSRPHVHIAAIDNSLSFPIHHPNSWRSYCYGWLFLPSSLIGQPFSKQTRDHFLPILTDPKWWSETVFQLRQLFSQDDDFSEKMFRKQIALLKGQAWNVVMSLRNPEEGPLELCRRTPCVVHDDEMEVADDVFTREMLDATAAPPNQRNVILEEDDETTPRGSSTNNRPSMDRHSTTPDDRPTTPPAQPLAMPVHSRHSSDRPNMRRPLSYTHASHVSPRPLPTIKHVDLNRSTFGNATGVSLMEHMERIQRREEDVAQSLGVSLPTDLDDSEFLLGRRSTDMYSTSVPAAPHPRRSRQGASLDLDRRLVQPYGTGRLRSGSIDEVGRRMSSRGVVDNPGAEGTKTKIVIVERVEEVDARPYFVRC